MVLRVRRHTRAAFARSRYGAQRLRGPGTARGFCAVQVRTDYPHGRRGVCAPAHRTPVAGTRSASPASTSIRPAPRSSVDAPVKGQMSAHPNNSTRAGRRQGKKAPRRRGMMKLNRGQALKSSKHALRKIPSSHRRLVLAARTLAKSRLSSSFSWYRMPGHRDRRPASRHRRPASRARGRSVRR